jgi:hypothetical protein
MSIQIIHGPRKNQQYIFYVTLLTSGDNDAIQSNPTLAAGDVLVSTDGAATANAGTLPVVTPGSSRNVKVTLSASEMNGDNVVVTFEDQTGTEEWQALTISIHTQTAELSDVVDTSGAVEGVVLADAAHGGAAATITALSIAVTNSAGSAVTLTSSGGGGDGLRLAGEGAGAGFRSTGGTSGEGGTFVGGSSQGTALDITATGGNSVGLNIVGLGSGSGVAVTAGATGEGIYSVGGATSGAGIKCEAQNNLDSGLECVGHSTGEDILADSIQDIETDTANIQTRLPASLTGGHMDCNVRTWVGTTATISATTALPEVDAKSISDNAVAADNVQANIGNLDAAISTRSAPATAQTIDLTTAVPNGQGADTVGEALNFAHRQGSTALSGLSTLTRSDLFSTDNALVVDANGRVQVQSGTSTGQISATGGLANINLAQAVTETVSTKATIGEAFAAALASVYNRVASGGVGGNHVIYKRDGVTALSTRAQKTDELGTSA